MINSILKDNIDILNNIFKNNTKLKNISLSNNKLVYNNCFVDINKINLKMIFNDPYSKLVLDIKSDNIYPENFFEIMKINSYTIENEINNKYDIISFDHFKKLVSNYYVLSEKDFFDYVNFQKYIKLLMLQTTSEDTYLNIEQKELLDKYLSYMQYMLQNNNHNTTSNYYIKIVNDVNNEKKKRLKRIILNEQKDGFVNALLIIFMMMITGIIISIFGIYLI